MQTHTSQEVRDIRGYAVHTWNLVQLIQSVNDSAYPLIVRRRALKELKTRNLHNQYIDRHSRT